MRRVLSVWVVLAAAACAAGRVATPSGRPEVTVSGASVEDVQGAVVGECARRGWQIERADKYVVQAIAPNTNLMSNALLGSQLDPQTWFRISFTLAPARGGTTVYVSESLISNRGTAFERTQPLDSQKAFDGEMQLLQSIAASCASAGHH